MKLERAARPLLGLLLLGTVLVGCGAGGGHEADPAAAAPDRAMTYFGHLADVDTASGRLDLDLVGLRSDPSAPAEPGGGSVGEASWPVAADARAAVLDCAEVCTAVAVPVAALADGTAQPHHGRDALFEVVVEEEVVVSIAERALR